MSNIVFYTVNEVAKLFRLNHVTIRNLIKRGDLRAVKIGRGIRVPEDALKEYLEKIGASEGASEEVEADQSESAA